jgi:hypothetical protein
MKHIIIETKLPIAGGDEIRMQEGHNGCVEITKTPRTNGNSPRMRGEEEVVLARIPKHMRSRVAAFLQEAA